MPSGAPVGARPAADALELTPHASALRPPLKWAGGKRWQVPHVARLRVGHEHRRFVEPFCGGLALALGLRPYCALLNDINPHLVNFYRWVQRGLSVSRPMRNDRAEYYRARVRFNGLIDAGEAGAAEAAVLFYYLNRTGYNGLCRFNTHGHFNVPFGRYTTINYAAEFSAYRGAFVPWTFATGDFAELALQADDFIYADPPYDGGFAQFSSQVFDWRAQRRAATWLARHPGPVVLANRATTRIVRLYQSLGFELTSLRGPRRISCTGDRRQVVEVLATRNLGDAGVAAAFSRTATGGPHPRRSEGATR